MWKYAVEYQQQENSVNPIIPPVGTSKINFQMFSISKTYHGFGETSQTQIKRNRSIFRTQKMLRSSTWIQFMIVLIFKYGVLENTSGFHVLTLMTILRPQRGETMYGMVGIDFRAISRLTDNLIDKVHSLKFVLSF